ncbi:MAG: hypothetical protein HONDAALG_02040 [Gammaproteobacteria bacterium]|nr:hypothetical protein [Gammaproteobacteria bacterium]
MLGHVTQVLLPGTDEPRRLQLHPIDADGAPGRLDQPHEDGRQRRLAGAGHAGDADELVASDVETDVSQRLSVARRIGERDPLQPDPLGERQALRLLLRHTDDGVLESLDLPRHRFHGVPADIDQSQRAQDLVEQRRGAEERDDQQTKCRHAERLLTADEQDVAHQRDDRDDRRALDHQRRQGRQEVVVRVADEVAFLDAGEHVQKEALLRHDLGLLDQADSLPQHALPGFEDVVQIPAYSLEGLARRRVEQRRGQADAKQAREHLQRQCDQQQRAERREYRAADDQVDHAGDELIVDQAGQRDVQYHLGAGLLEEQPVVREEVEAHQPGAQTRLPACQRALLQPVEEPHVDVLHDHDAGDDCRHDDEEAMGPARLHGTEQPGEERMAGQALRTQGNDEQRIDEADADQLDDAGHQAQPEERRQLPSPASHFPADEAPGCRREACPDRNCHNADTAFSVASSSANEVARRNHCRPSCAHRCGERNRSVSRSK